MLASRLAEGSGWQFETFALPILFPYVPDATWDEINDLRRHPGLVSFRGELKQLEQEIGAEVGVGGDVQAAVHHAYEQRLSEMNRRVESLGTAVRRQVVALGVGLAVGAVSLPLSPPLALAVGSTPTVASAGTALTRWARQRRRQPWVSFDWQLRQLSE